MSLRCKQKSFYVGGAKTHVAYTSLPQNHIRPVTTTMVRVVTGTAGPHEINVQELARRYNEFMALGWTGKMLIPGTTFEDFRAATPMRSYEKEQYAHLGVTGAALGGVMSGTTHTFDPDAIFGRKGQKRIRLMNRLWGPQLTNTDNLGAYRLATTELEKKSNAITARVFANESSSPYRQYIYEIESLNPTPDLGDYEIALSNFADNPGAQAQRSLVYEWAYAYNDTELALVTLLDRLAQIDHNMATLDPGRPFGNTLFQAEKVRVIRSVDETLETMRTLSKRIRVAKQNASKAAVHLAQANSFEASLAAQAAADDDAIVAAARAEAALTTHEFDGASFVDTAQPSALADMPDMASPWTSDVITNAQQRITSQSPTPATPSASTDDYLRGV
jgi:hypothetical protein